MMYKKTSGTEIIRLADNTTIAANDSNTDYQEFKRWIAKGNMIQPADAPTSAELNAPVVAKLAEIDIKSIRSLREYIAKLPDAPAFLKQLEADAAVERTKLKP